MKFTYQKVIHHYVMGNALYKYENMELILHISSDTRNIRKIFIDLFIPTNIKKLNDALNLLILHDYVFHLTEIFFCTLNEMSFLFI